MSQARTRYRIGHGFDAHRLVADRPLILGGVHVPFERGALGHSDADVLCHALSDALLGGANLGSLGDLFPDTDPKFKDANSLQLLATCMTRVAIAGYSIENIDATVVVQQPRLAPFIRAMQAKIAEVLEIDIADVSIKAKTSEGMGYTGDGSGIAAYAVVLLVKE
jgi:2-C-methyl-D-erythritol 2,4-cyclodiphosphate synthase